MDSASRGGKGEGGRRVEQKKVLFCHMSMDRIVLVVNNVAAYANAVSEGRARYYGSRTQQAGVIRYREDFLSCVSKCYEIELFAEIVVGDDLSIHCRDINSL